MEMKPLIEAILNHKRPCLLRDARLRFNVASDHELQRSCHCPIT